MDENNEKIPQEKPAHAASNGGSAQNRERRSRNNGRRPGKRPPNNRKNDRQHPCAQERWGASAVPTDAAERPRRTAGDVQPATDTLDRFADISLSGSGRLGLASSSVIADESDDAPLPPDAFRIPDSEILPECLLPHESAPAEVQTPTQDLTEVVGVRFENSGKTYYFAPGADKFKRGEHAIVETSRGVEYGEISMGNTFVPNSEIVQPLRAVGRRANENDAKRNEENHRREAEAMKVCAEKIAAHGLDMKLVGSSYTFDNSKLIFYFTAAGRVDFRELVKDLAAVFRTRIELRQIGIREAAACAAESSAAPASCRTLRRSRSAWQRSRGSLSAHRKSPAAAADSCAACALSMRHTSARSGSPRRWIPLSRQWTAGAPLPKTVQSRAP